MGSLSELKVKLTADTAQYRRAMGRMKKQNTVFSRQMKQMGGAIAGAFAVGSLISFGSELITLGGKAQGVQAAFEKLNQPALLENLKKATRNTVDELTLMQKAVQANNFKIPLEQLATFFEFATKRAIQTGESVDYLVESLITGLGRKSVLVMDNLGISAIELQEEVKRVGDFGMAAGNIIRRELESMGEVANTATTETAQLATEWQNLKVNLGKVIAPGVAAFFKDINTFLGALDKGTDFEKITLSAASLHTQLEAYTIALQKAIDKGDKEFQKTMLEKIRLTGLAILQQNNLNSSQEAEVPIIEKLKDEIKELTGFRDLAVSPEILNRYNKLLELKREELKLVQQYNNELSRVKPKPAGSVNNNAPSGIPSYIPQRNETGEIDTSAIARFVNYSDESAAMLQRLYVDAFVIIGESIGDAFSGVASGGDVLANLIKMLASFGKEFGTMMIGVGIAAAAIKPLFKNPFGAVVGGTALVALSQAAANWGANIQQGHGMEKGGIVPPGFPNDSYPAFLTSGETVIPAPNTGAGMSINVGGQFVLRGGQLVALIERELTSQASGGRRFKFK